MHLGSSLRLSPALAVALAALVGGCATGSPSALAPRGQAASPQSLREALAAAYEHNRRALLSNDAAAVLALRTGDFQVVTPDGTIHDAREMSAFTHNLLANVERWEALSFDIETLEPRGNEVAADVRQHSIRIMRRGEGKTRRVENWVTQRETWLRTPAGWKIRRMDNIRDQRVLIDGVPRA